MKVAPKENGKWLLWKVGSLPREFECLGKHYASAELETGETLDLLTGRITSPPITYDKNTFTFKVGTAKIVLSKKGFENNLIFKFFTFINETKVPDLIVCVETIGGIKIKSIHQKNPQFDFSLKEVVRDFEIEQDLEKYISNLLGIKYDYSGFNEVPENKN